MIKEETEDQNKTLPQILKNGKITAIWVECGSQAVLKLRESSRMSSDVRVQ